jgi:hypothetical protein
MLIRQKQEKINRNNSECHVPRKIFGLACLRVASLAIGSGFLSLGTGIVNITYFNAMFEILKNRTCGSVLG